MFSLTRTLDEWVCGGAHVHTYTYMHTYTHMHTDVTLLLFIVQGPGDGSRRARDDTQGRSGSHP